MATQNEISEEYGVLFVVSTPIGNLEDITLRALRILKEADLIAAEDTRKTGILLKHYHIKNKTTNYHDFNKEKKTPYLLNELKSGKDVAIVSDAGTPGISDPCFYLVKKAIEEGMVISQTGDVMGGIRDELEYIATKASPTKVAEIAEDSEQYVAEIEEAAEILGGDPEIDLAIDVTDELNQLETEMLLEQGGTMPEIPSDDLQYIPEFDELEEEAEVKTKDKLKDEIDKLRKELDG